MDHQRRQSRWIKALAAGGFLFFLGKGLLWLALGALAAVSVV